MAGLDSRLFLLHTSSTLEIVIQLIFGEVKGGNAVPAQQFKKVWLGALSRAATLG